MSDPEVVLERGGEDQRMVSDSRDEKMQYISQSIREIKDWPKKGILFQDITSMLLDAKVRSAAPTVRMRYS